MFSLILDQSNKNEHYGFNNMEFSLEGSVVSSVNPKRVKVEIFDIDGLYPFCIELYHLRYCVSLS